MKKILWLIMLIPALSLAEARYEIQEFTGTVKALGHRGIGLAYESIELDIAGKSQSFLFYRYYGKFFKENYKTGDQITLKANINITLQEQLSKYKNDPAHTTRYRDFFANDYIIEVKLKNEWIALPADKQKDVVFDPRNARVFLDQKVESVYKDDGKTVALIFKDGLVANFRFGKYARMSIDHIKPGDLVSFNGYHESGAEAVYPIDNVRKVYSFQMLTKHKGTIKSLLYKQNNVCIGLTFSTATEGDIKVSFPSDYAARINQIAQRNAEVTIYKGGGSNEKLLTYPELHAVASEKDTFKIDVLYFFGGPDVKHEYTTETISGKITKINRTPNNRIISFIVSNEVYVDVNVGNAGQIVQYLEKGAEVEVTGEQRIKKEGELYLKDYRIIVPRRVKIDGKEFIIL